jgi:hypothetical protein
MNFFMGRSFRVENSVVEERASGARQDHLVDHVDHAVAGQHVGGGDRALRPALVGDRQVASTVKLPPCRW